MDRLFKHLAFKIHFATYVAVNLLLIAINLLTTPQHLWFFWPLPAGASALLPMASPITTPAPAAAPSASPALKSGARLAGYGSARASHAAHALGQQAHDRKREFRLLPRRLRETRRDR